MPQALQDLVAGAVAVFVVELFEAVDIDDIRAAERLSNEGPTAEERRELDVSPDW